MHSLHWSGVISRVEKAKYARRFVLWKSSEYKKNGHKFCFRGNGTSVFRNFYFVFTFSKKKSPYRFFRQGIISGTFVFLKSATVANKLSGDSRLAYICFRYIQSIKKVLILLHNFLKFAVVKERYFLRCSPCPSLTATS